MANANRSGRTLKRESGPNLQRLLFGVYVSVAVDTAPEKIEEIGTRGCLPPRRTSTSRDSTPFTERRKEGERSAKAFPSPIF